MYRYSKYGLSWTILQLGVKFITKDITRDEAYLIIRRKVNERLQEEFADYIQSRVRVYEEANIGFCNQRHSYNGNGVHSMDYGPNYNGNRVVWTCWLQGFDFAPAIVRSCQESQKRHIIDRRIVQLTRNNYTDYVRLPEHIVQKYERGKIPPALFADLLRLEVLIEHGGTWMDATILLTDDGPRLKELLDADLFMFQALKKGDRSFYGISNWFISAKCCSRPLMVLRDVLTEYWRIYDVTLNYYMFHDFFCTIAQYYPEEIEAMPRKNRLGPLQLMQRNGYEFDSNGIRIKDDLWVRKLLENVCVHKIDYK